MTGETSRYKKFVPVVLAIAALSKDRSTKVGAVALGPGMEIRSTGYNGFPRGVNDDVDARHERPFKYFITAHAESNVVAQAARSGVSLDGCTVMVSSLFPCSNCAKMMIQAGVKRVIAVGVNKESMTRWAEEWAYSKLMFEEAGVEFCEIEEQS